MLNSICYFLESIEKSMLVNSYVENWIIIMDVDNLSVFRLPLKVITKIVETTATYFCTRMEYMFIINPSFVLKTGWNLVASKMELKTLLKICFLRVLKIKFGLLHNNNSGKLLKKYHQINFLKNILDSFPI